MSDPRPVSQDAAEVRAAVAMEIAEAIENMDLPFGAELTGAKAVGFQSARGLAAAVARAHAVEGGRYPRDMTDYITGGGV